MKTINKQINEFCPDGVEYVTLTTIFNTRNGYTPSKSVTSYWTDGNLPWFRMEDIREKGHILSDSIQHVNRSAVKGDLFPENSIIVATSATIGEHALLTVPSLANQRFTFLMLKDDWKDKYDIKFLYYYCYKLDKWCLDHLNQGSFASVDMKQFVNFKFPVPPLPVQREIVRILDEFTEKMERLKTELAAELEARKKQYEYYRDSLVKNSGGAYLKLKDIATDIYRGSGIKRDEVTDTGVPCVRYGEIYTSYEVAFDKCISHTLESVVASPKYFEHGDILFAITGESIDDIAKSITYLGNDKCMAGGDIVVMRHTQEPRYISYALSTSDAIAQKGKGKVKSKVVHSSVPAIQEISIPVPSLEKQIEIADKLDNYRHLLYDISFGLPAEIEARQKQYEYYRDKLLTFKELSSSIHN